MAAMVPLPQQSILLLPAVFTLRLRPRKVAANAPTAWSTRLSPFLYAEAPHTYLFGPDWGAYISPERCVPALEHQEQKMDRSVLTNMHIQK